MTSDDDATDNDDDDGETAEPKTDDDDEINIENSDNDDDNDDDDVDEDKTKAEPEGPRRSARETKPVESYEPSMTGKVYETNHLVTQMLERAEYDDEYVLLMIRTIMDMRDKDENSEVGSSFAETYSLNTGIKKLGERGYNAAFDEVNQLHQRGCFHPIDVNQLTPAEREKALESLIFLTEKRDGRAKARACADGRKQRLWMNKNEAASPTVLLESVMITSTIDAKENRDVAIVDIPNAFVQTDMEDGERVVMKLRGKLAELLVKVAPEVYRNYVTEENGKTVLYVELKKALYGMLKSALLFYKKLRRDLESIGFKVNPYDPCVANRMRVGLQLTVVWHVDDLKISHVDSKVVNDLIDWIRMKYEDVEIGKIKPSRGKVHDYLGMTLDFATKGVVKIKMLDYVSKMLDGFDYPKEIAKEVVSPASENLYKIDEESEKLDAKRAQEFHNMVAKGLFLTKRARPDLMTAIAFLCT